MQRISTLCLAAAAFTAALPAVADESSRDPAVILETTPATVTVVAGPMISVEDFRPTAIAYAAQPMSRDRAREEYRFARAHGMLSRAGEAGDTQDVLMARDEYNQAQAAAIVAEYQAEMDRRIALAIDAQRQQALASQPDLTPYP